MRYSRYFIVDAICGHVGRNNGIVKSFPVAAENAKHAAAVTRKFPRVKHDYKYAIQNVREVTKEEYLKQKEINKEDPYLLSKSKYEQNLNCDNLSIFPMNEIIGKTAFVDLFDKVSLLVLAGLLLTLAFVVYIIIFAGVSYGTYIVIAVFSRPHAA